MADIKIGDAVLSEEYLRHHFERLFWKQSDSLRTFESCDRESKRVVDALKFLCEEAAHYTEVSAKYRKGDRG